ncbi:unnamed protein product, partial [marine sediment metagenome]
DSWVANAANYNGSGDPYESGIYPWTTPVGYFGGGDHGGAYQTADGRSPYGAHDMAGNVWDWVNDWYDANYYSLYPVDEWPPDPQGPESDTFRVQRGGCWNRGPGFVRASNRHGNAPDDRGTIVGFRCVRDG